jgi:ERF superfamily
MSEATTPTYSDPVDLGDAIDENELIADAPLRLLAKLDAIQATVDGLQKNGQGGDGSGDTFEFVRSEDALRAVRAEMVQHHLICKPDTTGSVHSPREGGRVLTSVSMSYTWICCETGQQLSCEWKGTGEDGSDKGLYKGYTGSKKYFLLDFFSIPTFADPERAQTGQAAERPPLRAVSDDDNGVQGQQLDALLSALEVLGVSDEEQNTIGEWAVAAATSGGVTRRMARLTNSETSDQEVKAIVATAIGWKLSQETAA